MPGSTKAASANPGSAACARACAASKAGLPRRVAFGPKGYAGGPETLRCGYAASVKMASSQGILPPIEGGGSAVQQIVGLWLMIGGLLVAGTKYLADHAHSIAHLLR